MKVNIRSAIFGLALLMGSQSAFALSSYQSRVPNGTFSSCDTCHDLASGPPVLNQFGSAFLAAGIAWTPALAALDSDGDGFTNGQELGDPAGTWTRGTPNPTGTITNPGDPASHPSATAPAITTEPVSQTVTAGANVTFTVVATGTAPLSYQWQKDTVDIPGATNDTLTLNSVAAGDAGSYVVVVGNTAGSIPSAAATLTVNVTPVTLQILRTDASTVQISWAVALSGYLLQENSDLGATNWVDATNTISVANERNQVSISPLSTNRFYRLIHR